MKRSGLLAVLAGLILSTYPTAGYVVPDSVRTRFEGRRLTSVEGVWAWSSGATVAVVSDERGNITLTLLDSPDPAVTVPQIMGTGHFAGDGVSYDVRIRTDIDDATGRFKPKTQRCILHIDDGMLGIRPYSTGYRINLWRLVPYLFRFSVTKEKAPSRTDGAVRIYPRSPNPLIPPVL